MISDLIDQVHNLIILLNKELKENDISNEKTIRSLKTSIILLQVCVLEKICNFFAELILNLNNNDVKGAPEFKCKLQQDKTYFLKEEFTKTNSKGEKIIRHSGNSIEEKMTETPKILGSLYGVQVRIDKSGQEWQKFKEKLKTKRNKLAHPKFNIFKDVPSTLDINNIRPNVIIDGEDIIIGLETIIWYLQEMEIVIKKI